MKSRKLRDRFAVASSLGAVAMSAALLLGVGLAQPVSAAITVPPFPSLGTYPEWLPAGAQVSNIDHSEGSDTTLFTMETISNLYAQAGLFPFSCQLTTSPQNQQCLTPAENSGNNPDNTQSDTVDNFAGTEELQGINDVGSSNGQGELCGTTGSPVQGTVDYARSSKPEGSACAGLVQFGFAKDAVTAVDFQAINPEAYGTVSPSTGYVGHSFISYDYTSGSTITTAFPSGSIGDVADGWLPGDPYDCGFNGGPTCSGTAFTDVDNLGTLDGGTTTSSTFGSDAFRLWCQHGSGFGAGLNQIMDWGDLTNLGPNLEVLNVTLNGTTTATLASGENFPSTVANGDAVSDLTTAGNIAAGTTVSGVSGGTLTLSHAAGTGTNTLRIVTASNLAPGQGLPIGVPIRIIGVNNGSGTTSTFNNFAKGFPFAGSSSTNCATGPTNGSGDNYNANAAQGSNPQSPQGESGNDEIALENDSNQIGDFANANWPASDPADQAIDIATSLYFMGNGAFLSNTNAGTADLEATSNVPAGQPTAFVVTQLDANQSGNVGGVGAQAIQLNSFPMDRTLFNIVRLSTVRASVGGFINWMCDGGAPAKFSDDNNLLVSPQETKGTDHINGGNYDTDLTDVIENQYDYSRLTDTTQELSAGQLTTQNSVQNPNGTCDAYEPIAGGGMTTSSATVSIPAATANGLANVGTGWNVYVPAGYSLKLPAGTTVLSVNTVADTITLSAMPVSSTGTSIPPDLYFPGHPPVLGVSDPNT